MSRREMSFFRTPIFEQVHERLATQIAAGIYQVGKYLPNEADLAREMGVSTGTMRKALDQLEAEFVVTRAQGRGTLVKAKEPAAVCSHCAGTGRISPEKAA